MALGSSVRLRPGVRLRYDRARSATVLLYPEGVLVAYETAAAVLARCDGSASLAEIADDLTGEFDGVAPDEIVALAARLVALQLVEIADG
ncbi:MAG: pyrroloquinoline quinone biosynthesis peptide chaperone PqqD [Egibacteraceae bacterium]